MSNAKVLQFPVNGQEIPVSIQKKYNDSHISGHAHQHDEVCEDKLLLPSGESVTHFKQRQRDLAKATGRKLTAQYSHATLEEFGLSYPALLQQVTARIQQRYRSALQCSEPARHFSELADCAGRGHLQATLEVARYLLAANSSLGIALAIDAHHMGHTEALLVIGAAYTTRGDQAQGVRALLAGAWCGSFRCAQVLLGMLATPESFCRPQTIQALEEGCEYGSLHAKYLLGYCLLHGTMAYRNEARGQALLKEAEAVKHFRGDKGTGPTETIDGKTYATAGSLAHLELLIDTEVGAMAMAKLEPLLSDLSREPGLSTAEYFEKMDHLLAEHNPITERMAGRISDWMTAGRNTPPDPAKLARMQELYGDTRANQANGDNHE